MFVPAAKKETTKRLTVVAEIHAYLYKGVEKNADVLFNPTFDASDNWRTYRVIMASKYDGLDVGVSKEELARLQQAGVPTDMAPGKDQMDVSRYVSFTVDIPDEKMVDGKLPADAAIYATELINTYLPDKKLFSKLTAGSTRIYVRDLLREDVVVKPLVNYGLSAEGIASSDRDLVKGYVKMSLVESNVESAAVQEEDIVPENFDPIMSLLNQELSRLSDEVLRLPQFLGETRRVYCDHYNNPVLPLPPNFFFSGFDAPDVDMLSMRRILDSACETHGITAEWLQSKLEQAANPNIAFDRHQWLALEVLCEALTIVPNAQVYSPDDATYRNPSTGRVEIATIEMFDDGLRRLFSDCEDDAKEIITLAMWLRDVYDGGDSVLCAAKLVMKSYVSMAMLLSVLGAALSDGGEDGTTGALRLDNPALYGRVGAHMMAVGMEVSYFEQVVGGTIPPAFAAERYRHNRKLPNLFWEGTGAEASLLHESHYLGPGSTDRHYYSDRLKEAFRRIVAPKVIEQKLAGELEGDVEVEIPEFLLEFESRKMMEDRDWNSLVDMPSEFYRVQTTAFMPIRRGCKWDEQKHNGRWFGQLDLTTTRTIDGGRTEGVPLRGVPAMLVQTKDTSVGVVPAPEFSAKVERILERASQHLPHNEQMNVMVSADYASKVAATTSAMVESYIAGSGRGGTKLVNEPMLADPEDEGHVVYNVWTRLQQADERLFQQAGSVLEPNPFVEAVRIWTNVLHENLAVINLSILVHV